MDKQYFEACDHLCLDCYYYSDNSWNMLHVDSIERDEQ